MIKRYHITLGATTTASGTVTSASSVMSIDGANIALEGDSVFCKACDSYGVIKLDGPRLSFRFDNREVALSDDLCICKCSQPPRLVSIQTRKVQWIDADWHADMVDAVAQAAAKLNTAGGAASASDDAPVVLLDPKTEEPCKHRRYRLELKDKVIEGMTDRNGATRPLTAAERAAIVRWHVDDKSATA
jgi:uncharacterized Zn-binding protein involved in type VI secretion